MESDLLSVAHTLGDVHLQDLTLRYHLLVKQKRTSALCGIETNLIAIGSVLTLTCNLKL